MASAEELSKILFGAIGGNDESATVKHYLDTGFPLLNHALSNDWNKGFPVGRVVEISGPPSAGKTAIATRAMISAQKAGGIAAFCDHERSFAITLAKNLGLNDASGWIYRKPETYEQSVSLLTQAATVIREKKLIAPDAPICWVFDSMAAMVPYSILYDSKGNLRTPDNRNMKDNLALAAANSAHMPAVAQKAEDLGVCVLVLNQLRSKPGVMYGDPTYTPGGEAKEYYYSQRMRLSAQRIQKGEAKEAEVIGMEVTGKMTKNKVARPFLKATWRFMFQADGSGKFDVERSMVDFLEKEKLIPAATTAKGAERKGYLEFEGAQYTKEQLARKIEAEGALDKLKALLPAKYEPAVEPDEEPAAEAA
jgi:RecA/RadA recombinase